jgi:hypothetical protein
MTREGRDLEGLAVRGSDHLTGYNLYAEGFRVAGYVGEVYGLSRHMFDPERIPHWAEQRGVLVKSLEDAALAMASVYRSVGMPLPTTLPLARDQTIKRFADLVARFMPFDLVIEEQTVDGHEARVSKTSMCGSWGAVAGSLRYFADRFGIPRASIEGTQLSMDLISRYAERHPPELALNVEHKRAPVQLRRRVTYHGFELSHEREPLPTFPPELASAARALLADALARGELHHPAVRRNQPIVDEIRTVWRKLGGRTPRLGQAELSAWYASQMSEVVDWESLRALPLRLERRVFVDDEALMEARALPDEIEIRERAVPLEYDVEETDGALQPVVRLRLPEKVARTLVVEELPTLDRPLRFVVPRGHRGAVRAADLLTLQQRLDDPYTDEERETAQRQRDAQGSRPRGRDARPGSGRDGRPGGHRGGGKSDANRGGHRGGGKKGGGRRGGGRGR